MVFGGLERVFGWSGEMIRLVAVVVEQWLLSCLLTLAIGGHLTRGTLDSRRLLVVVDWDALALQSLHTLRVYVVDLDDVVRVKVMEIVLLCDDTLRVQVISVDCRDHCLVVLMVHIILNDKCLACLIVLLGCLVDNNVVIGHPA